MGFVSCNDSSVRVVTCGFILVVGLAMECLALIMIMRGRCQSLLFALSE